VGLVHVTVVTVVFYMIARFEIVIEIPPSWRKAFARKIMGEFFGFYYSYLTATRIEGMAMIIG